MENKGFVLWILLLMSKPTSVGRMNFAMMGLEHDKLKSGKKLLVVLNKTKLFLKKVLLLEILVH
jgi:hypothetical protein